MARFVIPPCVLSEIPSCYNAGKIAADVQAEVNAGEVRKADQKQTAKLVSKKVDGYDTLYADIRTKTGETIRAVLNTGMKFHGWCLLQDEIQRWCATPVVIPQYFLNWFDKHHRSADKPENKPENRES